MDDAVVDNVIWNSYPFGNLCVLFRIFHAYKLYLTRFVRYATSTALRNVIRVIYKTNNFLGIMWLRMKLNCDVIYNLLADDRELSN